MTLHNFLIENRADIIADTEKRTVALAALRPSSDQMRLGLPLFFDQLIEILELRLADVSPHDELVITAAANAHGKELLRLGYTLSHVVHSYGAMCQSITEVASLKKAPVTALEFHLLNRCLDIAIAGAVTEFESIRQTQNKNREVIHLGAVAHELRNALNRAKISFQMLSKGVVGLGGSTSKVLERSLDDMDILINRSLSEVRFRADSELTEEYFTVMEVVSQLVVTAEVEASRKQQVIAVEVDPLLGLFTDRHLITAALGNLLQNALKFTGAGGKIKIIGRAEGDLALIKVWDQGGGISADRIAQLFRPFEQQNKDRSGMGLGLLISREAVQKCGGTLEVRNVDLGCIFTIRLPSKPAPLQVEPGPVV